MAKTLDRKMALISPTKQTYRQQRTALADSESSL
jgi:hypothetical protein